MASARAGEPDRYLAALLARPAARDGLLALAAFSAELGRIPHLVTREPMMGEVRLQWWRDAIERGAGPGGADVRTGHPVADALHEARIRHELPVSLLLGIIDARASELAAEPFADEDSLTAYFAGSEAALFNLAARVTGARLQPGLEHACNSAGHAYGLTRLLLGIPRAVAAGRMPLPPGRLARAGLTSRQILSGPGAGEVAALMRDLHADVRQTLEAALQHVAKLPRISRVAFLPLALVGPYLRALGRPGRHALQEVADVAPLQRVWSIARAHWLGRM